jgi:hypothetical protein
VANLRVIDFYFFKDKDGSAVAITSAHYFEMLWNFLTPELSCGIVLLTIWFQQDCATAHTPRPSMEVIQEIFPEHIISLRGELPRPARSPDISAYNYFL